jgi:hypothetical protein
MRSTSLVVMGVECAMGALLVVAGVIGLTGRRVVALRARQRLAWRPYGWGQLFLGVFTGIESVPRLAGLSSRVLLMTSAVAVVPLVAAILMLIKAQRAR